MRILVCGAGGFIGHHLVKRLKQDGHHVTGVDLKHPEFTTTTADKFIIGDLRDPNVCSSLFTIKYDEVYQLAADMGGAGYLFSGEHDVDVMCNSSLINLNIVNVCRANPPGRIFYSSSACVYPMRNQNDTQNHHCAEDSVYPADPDSEYGWEKIFSERLYAATARSSNIICRIARFHNIFGPDGTWDGGKEKVPAALCRKIAQAHDGTSIEIWGDGKQTRTFLYITDCIDAVLQFMRSEYNYPLNIGSEELVSINELASIIS
jgi:GDP-D-mannose 3', 5'-epimerase